MDKTPFLSTMLALYKDKLNDYHNQIIIVSHWIMIKAGFGNVEQGKVDEFIHFDERDEKGVWINHMVDTKKVSANYLMEKYIFAVEFS
ncbi:unnamed protein product, partial [Adineta steineri]